MADSITWDTPKAVIVAGFIGGLISLSFIDGMGPKRRLVALLTGIAMAHYLTPLIAFLANEDKYQETIGFLVGLFGMSICAAIFRAIQQSNLWAFILRRWAPAAQIVPPADQEGVP